MPVKHRDAPEYEYVPYLKPGVAYKPAREAIPAKGGRPAMPAFPEQPAEEAVWGAMRRRDDTEDWQFVPWDDLPEEVRHAIGDRTARKRAVQSTGGLAGAASSQRVN